MENNEKNIIKSLFNYLKIEKDFKYKCLKCKDVGFIFKNDIAYICTYCNLKKKDNYIPKKLKNIYFEDFNLKYYPK